MVAACAVAALACGIVVADARGFGGVTSARIITAGITGAPQVTVYGCDNFTGSNGAGLNSRAATAATPCNNRTWSVVNGTWSIQSNAAQSNPLLLGTGLVIMNTATGTSVSVRAAVPSVGLGLLGATAGVVASYTNTSTFLRAQIRRGVLVGLLGDFVELTYGGSVVASVAYTITAGSTPELRITRSGATVGVRVDGTVMITHTLTGGQNTSLTGGQAGMYFSGEAGIRLDDFAVTGADP